MGCYRSIVTWIVRNRPMAEVLVESKLKLGEPTELVFTYGVRRSNMFCVDNVSLVFPDCPLPWKVYPIVPSKVVHEATCCSGSVSVFREGPV